MVRSLTLPEQIIGELAMYHYLTAEQLIRVLGYAPSSRTHMEENLRKLAASGLVLPLAGKAFNLPRVYTLTAKGRRYAALLGKEPGKQRFRPGEERDIQHNMFFIRHFLAVSDVLIAARLLAQTTPGIVLTRLYQEHELKGKLSLPLHLPRQSRPQTIVLVPDAALQFIIADTWEDVFYMEVYRNFPAEARFKQKVAAYVALAHSPLHRELFATDALSVAMLATPPLLAQTLKTWTEEALTVLGQPEEGQRFFFASIATEQATPQAMYLLPVWRQAYGSSPTPLLVVEEGQEVSP
jgi:hypothetical protein